MYRLEKLELNGFKSFSAPTEFTFGPGITAVVGPNGCGKSNIADAITWVIGEQSTRVLRAEHMGDVIFNGTDARKPMGMAEVSLRLSGTSDPATAILLHGNGNGNGDGAEGPEGNGDGAAAIEEPVPAASPERREIVITRRLFRSGESDYLIDGQKCRLRDVQELLAEVHVGSGLYTVIEQGRVDSVLLSRPRERRVLIEEAAGIALYKVRKRQAQAKLEATEANLLRIHDIVSEIEKQIGSLKRQAARARRYARIAAAIEKGERVLFHHEALRLDAEMEKLTERRHELESRETEAAAEMGRREAGLASARETAAEEAARHQSARESLHALDRTLDQLKAAIDRCRELEAEAQGQIARGSASIGSLEERKLAALARTAALAVEIDSVREASALAEASVRELESESRLDVSAIQAAEASLAAAREEALVAAGALSECRSEIRRHEENAARLRGEENRLGRLLEEAAAEAAALEARSREHHAGRASLAVSEQRLRESLEEAGRCLREEEARREAHLLEREELRGRLRGLEERLSSLEGLDAEPSADVGDAIPSGRLRMLKDVLVPPERLDRAVDAALNGLLRGFLTDSIDEAAAVVAALKVRGRGRAILIPTGGGPFASAEVASAPPPAPGSLGTLRDLLGGASEAGPALASILGRVAVTEDLGAALGLRASTPGVDVVTLHGDFVSRDGWVEGGAEVPEEAGVMTLKRLLDRLAVDARAARGRIADLDAAIAASEASLERLRSEAQEWKRRESDLAREDEASRHQGESLLTEASRLSLRREAHEGDRARVIEDLSEAAAACASLGSLLEGTLHRHDQLLREAESLAGAVEALRTAAAARSGSLAEAARAAAGVRERRAALEAEGKHQAQAVSELRERLARENEERVRWEERLGEARSRLEADAGTLADRMAERILAEGAVASAEAVLLDRRAALPGLEEAVRRARAALDEAREALHAHALEEERLAGDRRGLESRIVERGLPSLAAAIADLTDEERSADPEKVRAEMASWREKRDAMGAVNLMAVDQFRELEERHAFITGQRRDLEESIRSLKETIARINRQSRERFMDAFERIRAGFTDIFKTLFGGGRADLRLVTDGAEEGDLLEAGLEISVQPPGKRLQSLSLLSGGEKALTAIALLFAIFRYSPSPFCLLDEVDAPLDEANVMRFNTLLGKMSAETQFVMITHNRRSMEAAAMLYGITMEEPGVSRTVSVVMASDEDRKEAARTLPSLLASRHRGAGMARRVGPAPAAGHDA